jgi:hypothetical protein
MIAEYGDLVRVTGLDAPDQEPPRARLAVPLLWLRDVPARPVRIAADAALALQAADDTHGPSSVVPSIPYGAHQVIQVKWLFNLAVRLKKSLDDVGDALIDLSQMLLASNSIRWGGSPVLASNPLFPLRWGCHTR